MYTMWIRLNFVAVFDCALYMHCLRDENRSCVYGCICVCVWGVCVWGGVCMCVCGGYVCVYVMCMFICVREWIDQ